MSPRVRGGGIIQSEGLVQWIVGKGAAVVFFLLAVMQLLLLLHIGKNPDCFRVWNDYMHFVFVVVLGFGAGFMWGISDAVKDLE